MNLPLTPEAQIMPESNEGDFVKRNTLSVLGREVALLTAKKDDYISITDIARHKNPSEPKDVVKNWMRSRTTIEFLGLWEKLHNSDFKGVEFDTFMFQAGSNSFVLSPSKWIESTHAIGIMARSGKNGGTYAHKDIAFEFASWISPEFKLYLIVEFQRLKNAEHERSKLDWDIHRTLAKVNYRIHTDAVKEKLIPPILSKGQINEVYANEADMLNVALFGKTARQWREDNTDMEGNLRDHATIEQLVVLSNLESINAVLIRQGVEQSLRLQQLNAIAITQIRSLLGHPSLSKLKSKVQTAESKLSKFNTPN